MTCIPTAIDLCEMFSFLQKSATAVEITHLKVLSQDDSDDVYCVLCAFSADTVELQY